MRFKKIFGGIEYNFLFKELKHKQNDVIPEQQCFSRAVCFKRWGGVWDLGTWKRHRQRDELRKVRNCEVLVLAGLPCALGGFAELDSHFLLGGLGWVNTLHPETPFCVQPVVRATEACRCAGVKNAQ